MQSRNVLAGPLKIGFPWGIDFYENDEDLHDLSVLNKEFGLDALGCKLSAPYERSIGSLPVEGYEQHIETVRIHLDAGVLDAFSERYFGPTQNQLAGTVREPMHLFALVIITAMQFGARLPPAMRSYVGITYREIGLYHGMVDQLDCALHLYKEGMPYVLPASKYGHCIDANGNILSGRGSQYPMGMWEMPGKLISVHQFRQGVCQLCGNERSVADGAVKKCGRCKKVHYCSESCQKSHWRLHKRTCH